MLALGKSNTVVSMKNTKRTSYVEDTPLAPFPPSLSVALHLPPVSSCVQIPQNTSPLVRYPGNKASPSIRFLAHHISSKGSFPCPGLLYPVMPKKKSSKLSIARFPAEKCSSVVFATYEAVARCWSESTAASAPNYVQACGVSHAR